MPLRESPVVGRDVKAALRGALVLFATAAIGCNATTDATTAIDSSSSSSTFSFTLAPSSVTVSPGSSALTIGTIRGAAGLELTFVVGTVPNGVSVRVTSDTDGGGVTTKKVIIFTDAATVPGTYVVGIKLVASGRPDIEAPLTLVVAR